MSSVFAAAYRLNTTVAKLRAVLRWRLLTERKELQSLGGLVARRALQEASTVLNAIHPSDWQVVAARAYGSSAVAEIVARIIRVLHPADQIGRGEDDASTCWLDPIVWD